MKTFALVASAGAVVAGVLLSSPGCASYSHRHPEPVTVSQILDMSKAGMPPEEIIAKMRASGTVYRLKASQLSELEKNGVPTVVIDYMQQTYINAVKCDSDYENWRHWTMYDDYWYGGVPFGWPYDTVYVIRERHPPEQLAQPPHNEHHEVQEREHHEVREHEHRRP